MSKNKKTTEAADNTNVSPAYTSADNGVDSLPGDKASATKSVRSNDSITETEKNVNSKIPSIPMVSVRLSMLLTCGNAPSIITAQTD